MGRPGHQQEHEIVMLLNFADELRRRVPLGKLMELYANHPMDLADPSLLVAAEALGTRRVFTIDRDDFEPYRVRRGHRHQSIQIVG